MMPKNLKTVIRIKLYNYKIMYEILVKDKNKKILTIISKTTNSQLPMSNVEI